MRTYLILKEKAARFEKDSEIQALLKEINAARPGIPAVGRFSKKGAQALLSQTFDKAEIMTHRLPYERLDQLTMEIIFGTR